RPGARVIVDLERQLVVGPDGGNHRFEIDAYRKRCLLEGLDELGFTLGCRAEIEAFERGRAETTPWL
ncbi:MAG TPA: 3-isopropylmalate dehydratase small subunit, partial [Acetobacteraceae bacterium]|nr:3-isopropylmalate dehydratase small subunit [Acetobacteraceae bacterium]